MAITPKFTNAQIEAELRRRFTMIEAAVLSRLQRVGEQFITNARERGSYQDQTGNLRNSIGYVVLKNGQQVSSGGLSGGGAAAGRTALNDAAARFPTGYVLIVVAGMDYAAAVESKGKDVLTGSAPDAVEALRKAVETIGRKVGRI